eukprot:scaffold1088_cov247-Pinguiococcus_pyrenoidosus.AAC.23
MGARAAPVGERVYKPQGLGGPWTLAGFTWQVPRCQDGRVSQTQRGRKSAPDVLGHPTASMRSLCQAATTGSEPGFSRSCHGLCPGGNP